MSMSMYMYVYIYIYIYIHLYVGLVGSHNQTLASHISDTSERGASRMTLKPRRAISKTSFCQTSWHVQHTEIITVTITFIMPCCNDPGVLNMPIEDFVLPNSALAKMVALHMLDA